MSKVEALRDRLIAELEAAVSAAMAAATEEVPTDATDVLAAVARVAHYERTYAAGTRTVVELTLPKCWPLPTAERIARWLLKYPEKLTLASAVAEAAMLPPYERDAAYRAAERWLKNFYDPYKLEPGGVTETWSTDDWLSWAAQFLSDHSSSLSRFRPSAPAAL